MNFVHMNFLDPYTPKEFPNPHAWDSITSVTNMLKPETARSVGPSVTNEM